MNYVELLHVREATRDNVIEVFEYETGDADLKTVIAATRHSRRHWRYFRCARNRVRFWRLDDETQRIRYIPKWVVTTEEDLG